MRTVTKRAAEISWLFQPCPSLLLPHSTPAWWLQGRMCCTPASACGVDKKDVQVRAGLASRGVAALPQTPAASGALQPQFGPAAAFLTGLSPCSCPACEGPGAPCCVKLRAFACRHFMIIELAANKGTGKRSCNKAASTLASAQHILSSGLRRLRCNILLVHTNTDEHCGNPEQKQPARQSPSNRQVKYITGAHLVPDTEWESVGEAAESAASPNSFLASCVLGGPHEAPEAKTHMTNLT
ncbi:hypothetical protein ABBQ32_012945 [Trebouxia sp. C0010 RCD-2024]